MCNRAPILEFDPARKALIEPWHVTRRRDVPEHCVICFFSEVIEQIVTEYQARIVFPNRWEDGPHPLYEIESQGQRLAFFHPGVGSALASGLLEEVIACGCRKFIVCGGCGVLEKDISVGHVVVVTSAVRDEGVSYHYLPAGREVSASPSGVSALEDVLNARQLAYRKGKTWTTDAPFRETPLKIERRKAEGCITVEMEAAALFAVAQFRNVALAQVLYAGDDVSGSEWDSRDWQRQTSTRKDLFWTVAEACLLL